MKTKLLLFFISISFFCCGQQQQYCINFPSFKINIFKILEDSSRIQSEYPKPPQVTDSVLLRMEIEIVADDSAKFFLERLSREKYKSAIDYESAFKYINKMDYGYTLLALCVHWNPDIRIKALLNLNQKLTIRPLINSVKMKNGDWKKYDKIAIEFLVYVLERNPLFISGSENSTIHSLYISNIIWNLDLLTHENIAEKKQFRDWYKNDLQFEHAVLIWKAHIK